jgi:hypothetical protein
MTSHRKVAGLEVSIGPGGLRFKRRPSAYNACVGNALRGKGPVLGGRAECRARFIAAVHACAGPKKEQLVEKAPQEQPVEAAVPEKVLATPVEEIAEAPSPEIPETPLRDIPETGDISSV